MFRRLQVIALLFAWFLSTGAQWDLLQTLGWGGMIVSYSKSMDLLDAVRETFDGELCQVCRAVKEAKEQQSQATLPNDKLGAKVLLALAPEQRLIAPALVSTRWVPDEAAAQTVGRAAPPTPPPRT